MAVLSIRSRQLIYRVRGVTIIGIYGAASRLAPRDAVPLAAGSAPGGLLAAETRRGTR